MNDHEETLSERANDEKDANVGDESTGRNKRVRKAVEAFVIDEPQTKRKTEIARGKGERLCDIPNVAFRLGKISRKEDILKFVYRVLYKGTPRQQTVKKEIGEFSGWTFESDADRAVKQDLLMRAFKETLHEMLDLFELPRGSGAEAKKEAQVERLMKFLDAPKASGKKSLAEAEEKKKAAKERKKARETKSVASKATKAKTNDSAALIKKLRAENAALRAKIAALTGKEEPAAEEDEEEEEEDEEEEEEEEEDDEEEEEDEEDEEEPSDEDSDDEFTAKKPATKKPKPAAKPVKEPTPEKSPAPKPTPAPKPEPAPKPTPPPAAAPKVAAAPEPMQPAPAAPTQTSNPTPSSADLKAAISAMLANANMNEVSMKTVRQNLEAKFGLPLGDRKDEIRQIVTNFIESQ